MPTLTPDAWAEIRYAYENTDRPVEDICLAHGISSGTLRDRMRRWQWRRRRPSIPHDGPPSCLIIDATPAPAANAVIVAKPSPIAAAADAHAERSRIAPHESEGNAAPSARDPASLRAPPLAPSLAPALQQAVTTVLPGIRLALAQIAAGQAYPDDAAKTARALHNLTRTLRELSVLLHGPQAQR
jgi:hypothetical protein